MKYLLLTLFCLAAPVAFGATQLEAMRAGASAARAQVSATRTSQLQSQAELNKLGSRIEELKAKAKGKLLPGSELDAALKQSQELSQSLTAAAAALSSQETALESANLALLSELSNELDRVRADFDRQTDRNVRTELIKRLRALRTEREQVRAMLPAAKLPALEAVKPSDDPEDLLEQADLLKDNEDKVRKQLQAVEKRIVDAKKMRDLDNRVRQFMADDSLFDESDRRLRVTRTEPSTQGTGAVNTPAPGDPAAPTRLTAGGESSSATLGAPSPQAAFEQADSSKSAGGAGSIQPPPPTFGPARDSSSPGTTPRSITGSDQRPAVGNRIAGNGDDDDLEDLEIQRAKLKGLAEELKARAAQLQKKASQLK